MYNPFSKISRVSRKMRRAYRQATLYLEYMDCGRQVAKYIKPSITTWENKFDQLADQLALLDPTFKVKFRFNNTTGEHT